MQVPSLGREDPLEGKMATCSSILTGKIPWTVELDRLRFMGLQRDRPGCRDRGSSPSSETSRPTGNPHGREDCEGTISTRLVLGSKHAVPGVPAAALPGPLPDRAPKMPGFCRPPTPSNLKGGITGRRAEKGFLTSCSQRVGDTRRPCGGLPRACGWAGVGGAGPEGGAHRGPGRHRGSAKLSRHPQMSQAG